MRHFLIIFLLTLTACAPAAFVAEPYLSPPPAPVLLSPISGVLTGETVLQGEYLLVSDLLIPKGSRLIIKSGSSIYVRRAEVTKIDPEFLSSMTELLIRGSIQIEGTPAAPVRFFPEQKTTLADPAWAGILLDNAEASSIRYSQISGAETGLLMIDAEVDLSDSRLEMNRYGVVIQSGSPLLERNLISNGEGGLFIWQGAAPKLVENIIRQNEEEGITIDRSSRPVLSRNRSQHNAIGLVSATLFTSDALQLSENTTAWRQLLSRQELKK